MIDNKIKKVRILYDVTDSSSWYSKESGVIVHVTENKRGERFVLLDTLSRELYRRNRAYTGPSGFLYISSKSFEYVQDEEVELDDNGNVWGEPTMADRITTICDEIKNILLEKNESYGNSAEDPVRIFSKADPIEQLNVRIDDKLSRIMRGKEFGTEDTELDLVGYFILKRAIQRR